MSTWRPKTCRDCKATVDAGAVISKQGYCRPCGLRRTAEAITSMVDKSGAQHERWTAHPLSRIGRPRPRGVGGSSPPE